MTDLAERTIEAAADAPTAFDELAPMDDDELTFQALAATPVATADDDAISYWDVVTPQDLGILPDWYMPSPSAGSRRLTGWRRRVVYLIIISIALIDAVGLCVTYGRVTFG